MNDDQQPQPPATNPVGKRIKSIAQRSREELARPGGLGDGAHGLLRRWFRKIWESRGGGLYALGFALTFLYLEIFELIADDIPQLFSINIISGDLFSFVLQFIVDTLKNTLLAFIWPITVIQWQWPVGIIALAIGFCVFPAVIQQPLERWIFQNQPPPSGEKKPRRKRKK